MNSIKKGLQGDLRAAGWHSRGYLPHFNGKEITQTITTRVAGSLPQFVLDRWQHELSSEPIQTADAAIRRRIESYLDRGYGACALRDAGVARMVQNALLYFDGDRYRLSAWVVMPNHAHILLTPHADWNLSKIMKSFKSYTSHEVNRMLGRRGQFWMEDYFDRYIRDAQHFADAIAYIENNPVKARLCKHPTDWPFSSARFR